jgi:regulator of nucleoside diphosphate kinase
MGKRTIYITAHDMEQLRKLLEDEKGRHGYGNGRGEHLKGLEAELHRSKCIADHKVPRDVITMHSTARLIDLDTGEGIVYTLVFPNEADIRQGKISVLAPIGTAMLGYRVGLYSNGRCRMECGVCKSRMSSINRRQLTLMRKSPIRLASSWRQCDGLQC